MAASSLLLELVICGELVSKANNRRVVINPRTNKLMVIKSKKAIAYEKEFTKQVLKKITPANFGSLVNPLRLDVVVYYTSRRSDLTIELLRDLLQKTGVIANDRYIQEEHVYGFIDKENPRVELRLYLMDKSRRPPYELS